MVITSWSCWLKTQQARLNTLVNIEPAETLFDGQFSTSANTTVGMFAILHTREVEQVDHLDQCSSGQASDAFVLG